MDHEPDEIEQRASAEPAETDTQALWEQLNEANRKANEYLNLLQRVQADFVNYRRRVEQERTDATRNIRADIISKVLPVIDDFERGLDAIPVGAKGLPWVQGMAMVERKLRALLDSEGVSPINPIGAEFDPWEHEAVLHEPTDRHPEGRVIEVLRPGYKMDSKVIRPAQVKVAASRTPD